MWHDARRRSTVARSAEHDSTIGVTKVALRMNAMARWAETSLLWLLSLLLPLSGKPNTSI